MSETVVLRSFKLQGLDIVGPLPFWVSRASPWRCQERSNFDLMLIPLQAGRSAWDCGAIDFQACVRNLPEQSTRDILSRPLSHVLRLGLPKSDDIHHPPVVVPFRRCCKWKFHFLLRSLVYPASVYLRSHLRSIWQKVVIGCSPWCLFSPSVPISFKPSESSSPSEVFSASAEGLTAPPLPSTHTHSTHPHVLPRTT